jgi:antitoxin component of RelBE/YafQ-DinJ toxin-antitoxin module
MKEKEIKFRIEESLKNDFYNACDSRKLNKSEVIRSLMRKFVAGNILLNR